MAEDSLVTAMDAEMSIGWRKRKNAPKRRPGIPERRQNRNETSGLAPRLEICAMGLYGTVTFVPNLSHLFPLPDRFSERLCIPRNAGRAAYATR
ncbi:MULTISPECIES: hypothetical protein [unclassified Roseovarius]|uniref:hypothetical protein n=1 Tax=unclassified Roseovarius TaxID=2614913 RepID=UPI00273DD616|nr:hypothetical protein [Roseovarius sp. MMSF_3350]